MSGEHELPTASVVRLSQATPARRGGQLCTMSDPQGSTYRSQFGVQATGATSMRSYFGIDTLWTSVQVND